MSNSLERANNGNKAENIILKENIRGTNGRGTSAFDDAANQYIECCFLEERKVPHLRKYRRYSERKPLICITPRIHEDRTDLMVLIIKKQEKNL